MNLLHKYIAYLQDNPEGYWFKRKLYGWGWTPATWQGWAVTGLYLLVIIASALTVGDNTTLREILFTFFMPVALSTFMLIHICYKKGEQPKWQWGLDEKKTDTTHEASDEEGDSDNSR